MPDVVYQAQLDDSQVLKALQNIDKNIDKLAKDASREFEGIGKAAKQSGVNIGVMSGVVSSLVTEFINLGKQAISALIEIGKQSVQTAIEMDTLKARLGGIFDGSEQAADQAFTFIQQKSKELGIDLGELAGAFLPKSKDLASFERIAKIATALALSDPEQGAIGARIALIEAQSGTFTSLQKRFEIDPADIDKIRDAFKNLGQEGAIAEIERVLEETGKSFDDLVNTAQISFNKLGIAGQQIGGRIGVPIVESLEQAANKIIDFVDANEDELIVFADTIGRAIASVVDLLTSINLKDIDPETLQEIANLFFDLTEDVKVFVSTLSSAEFPSSFLDGVKDFLSSLDQALITLNQINLIQKANEAATNAQTRSLVAQLRAKGEAEGRQAETEIAVFGLENIPGLTALNDELVKLVGNEEAVAFATKAAADGQAAHDKVIQDGLSAFDAAKKAKDENIEAQDKLNKTLDEEKEAGTGAADAILELAAAQKEAETAADDFEAAQTKVNEKMAEAEKDFSRKLEDIDIQTERKRLDIAIEFAQKREDAATDNLRKIEDIREKYADDVTDAATDLERKEEDIARKFGEQKIDQERERRQKRVDIERDFRLQLKDIQRQFLLDADEAEEKRDAVAFIRALKERDKKLQDARVERTTEIEELRISNQQKSEELRLQQERELEEARIANERKIEDLRLNLDRQIEEQNENYGQQLEDLALAEARKNEELNLWREREIEDANKAYARKLEDLQLALAAELAVIEEYAAKRAEIQARIDSLESARASTTTTLRGNSSYSSRQGGINTQRQQASYSSSRQGGINSTRQDRAVGGNVFAGGTYPVGERGMELFTPNQDGRIIPNSALTMPNFGSSGGMTNITNNNSKSASLGGLLDANSLDAILASKVENMLLRVLDKMS